MKEEEIFGYIERIVFQAEDSGFTVARLQEPKKQDLTTIVGKIPSLQPGETVRCRGKWKVDPKHGWQFDISSVEARRPEDIVGIEKYLGSGLVKGIGPIYAKRIVEAFGVKTLDIIDESPQRLMEVSGLGKKRVSKIQACWDEQRQIRELMVFLQRYDVSPTLAQKIFKCYQNESLKVVQENPYQLCRDIWGIGFKTADGLAAKLGMSKENPQRILAGIEYVLNKLSDDGHVCYPLNELLLAAAEMLDVDITHVHNLVDQLVREERLVLGQLPTEDGEGTFVWLKGLHVAELGIARQSKRISHCQAFLRQVDVSRAITWAEDKLKIRFAENQRQAVGMALREKLSIITGGPGTGKSTITNAILAISSALTKRIVLAAPTGRAAKRLNEITKYPAKTIHSLLEFDFKTMGFKRNLKNPLECDLIIIDEASMIDTYLMYSLMKAIPNHTRVVFVGDIDQLPSVGPGNVLRDIIDSTSIPVCRLTEIFRQAQGSKIIVSAHRINEGKIPFLDNQPNADFFFIEANEKEEVMQQVLGLVHQRLPKKYGFDCINEIQVLAPMKRGEIGTENLNCALQETLNPCSTPFFRGGKRLHPKDKVMQIRNNYQKEVYNGDVGTIEKIDEVEQVVIVNIDGRQIFYDFNELDEIVLAYAVSVHKYQGSECPCIVMPVHTTHFKLLHRNLLYTGVTRGKKLVVLVGMKKAVGIAVRNNEVKLRHTGLVHHLHDQMTPCLAH